MYLDRAHIDERSNPRKARHAHRGHELLAVVGGPGLQLTGAGEERCVDGDVFVFPAGVSHMSHAGPGQSFTCLVVQCDPGDFPDGAAGDGGAGLLGRIAEQARDGNHLLLRPATRALVRSFLERALDEWRLGAPGARCAARALVMEALVAVVRDRAFSGPDQPAPGEGDPGEHHLDAVQRWLEQYWMRPVAIADLVALGRLGRSQLLARFRARTGRTIGAELLAIRVRAAQTLLRAGEAGMLDIALTCGFGSQSHFNHRFKAATGMSPKVWAAGRIAE
jgi:AraC-like DNA-binding protein